MPTPEDLALKMRIFRKDCAYCSHGVNGGTLMAVIGEVLKILTSEEPGQLPIEKHVLAVGMLISTYTHMSAEGHRPKPGVAEQMSNAILSLLREIVAEVNPDFEPLKEADQVWFEDEPEWLKVTLEEYNLPENSD